MTDIMSSKTIWQRAVLCGMSFSLWGCASVMNLACDNKPYGGVAGEVEVWTSHPTETPGLFALSVVDLPFSFVVDTVALPYTLVSHYGFDVGKECLFAFH